MTVHILLWIIQAILAIKLTTTAVSHGLQHSKPDMRQAIEKMGGNSRLWHSLIAVLVLFSAVGLILPGLLGYMPSLTIWAAILSAFLLLGSIIFHTRYRDKPMVFVSIVLFIFSAFVAYGRYALAPFQ